MLNAQIGSVSGMQFNRAFRPLNNKETRVNKRTNQVQYFRNGLWVNSALRKDEWEELDAAVVEAAKIRTMIIGRIPQRPHSNLGVLASQWNVASEMTAADISMTGRSTGNRDRQDYLLREVPLPVLFKEFEIGERELIASRNMGDGIDVSTAYEAGKVVAESAANILYNGNTLNHNGSTIYGMTTHPNRNTASAAGDFGTIANIQPTVIAMINAATADRYYGPYELDIAATQYNECLATYTDGSGQTALQRILSLPQINAVNSVDQLAAGSLVLRQISRDVVEWAQVNLTGQSPRDAEPALSLSLMEWISGDGMAHNFKVMSVCAPRVKADYANRSGIVHYTGA